MCCDARRPGRGPAAAKRVAEPGPHGTARDRTAQPGTARHSPRPAATVPKPTCTFYDTTYMIYDYLRHLCPSAASAFPHAPRYVFLDNGACRAMLAMYIEYMF